MLDLISLMGGMLPSTQNTFIDIDGDHYISYCPAVDFNPGQEETAIVSTDSWRCLILSGNHLAAYQSILDLGAGLKGCEEYWSNHQDLWTEHSDKIVEELAIAA